MFENIIQDEGLLLTQRFNYERKIGPKAYPDYGTLTP